MDLQPGNLIKIRRCEITHGLYPRVLYAFCERTQETCPIPVGTICLVVNTSRISAVGNKVVDFFYEDKIVSMAILPKMNRKTYWYHKYVSNQLM